NPFGYHLTNLLLHIVNVMLVYFLCLRLIHPPAPLAPSRSIPFLTALFFAVYPIHTESVAWIKNRSDLLAAVFFFGSLLLFIRHASEEKVRGRILSYAGALACFILSLFSKEMALSLPFVLCLYALCFISREELKKTLAKTLPFFGVTALYLIFKVTALGMLVSAGNVSERLGIYPSFLVILKTVGYYLFLLAFPFDLNAERILNIPNSIFEPAVILSTLALLSLFIIIAKQFKRSRLISFSVIWILATLLPASNMIFLSGRPIAEQRLYIPSFGFALFLAAGIAMARALLIGRLARNTLRHAALLLSAVILISYSTAAMSRNRDWKDSITFWEKTAERSPRSAKARNNLGKAYYETGEIEKAIASYREALEINPRYPDTYNNLGVAYYDIDKKDEAAAFLKKAIEINPDYADVYNNLGRIYCDTGKLDEAVASYEKALAINPHYRAAYNNLGNLYYDTGRIEEAAFLYEKAMEIGPDHADTYNNLGNVYRKMGKTKKAAAFYKKAIKADPDYVRAYNNLGVAYYDMGDRAEAADLYREAIRIDPDYVKAYNNLGFLSSLAGEYEEASEIYRKSLMIDPGHAETYNNLAVVYYHTKQYGLAVRYCDRAIELGAEVNPDFLDALKPYRGKTAEDQ
ncbi:tetratricopeptide repeat protein, partial [Candidatus Omnitrophota bacterium]